jgi:hypothetical protein
VYVLLNIIAKIGGILAFKQNINIIFHNSITERHRSKSRASDSKSRSYRSINITNLLFKKKLKQNEYQHFVRWCFIYDTKLLFVSASVYVISRSVTWRDIRSIKCCYWLLCMSLIYLFINLWCMIIIIVDVRYFMFHSTN